MDALIGHTGFVGTSLLRAGRHFDCQFNSRNIREISGHAFTTVVCAGVSAVKWIANKEPIADWDAIQSLIDALDTVRAERFVLISTVDVYPAPIAVTEESPITESPEAYGRHRLRLENWVRERFETHHIVRLPGLFGRGLKKNVIFDLINGNNISLINRDSRFQWYPTERLSGDIDAIVEAGIRTMNIAPQPVETSRIIDAFFPEWAENISSKPNPARYDMRTRYAEVLGGTGAYHLTSGDLLDAMDRFLASSHPRASS